MFSPIEMPMALLVVSTVSVERCFLSYPPARRGKCRNSCRRSYVNTVFMVSEFRGQHTISDEYIRLTLR